MKLHVVISDETKKETGLFVYFVKQQGIKSGGDFECL